MRTPHFWLLFSVYLFTGLGSFFVSLHQLAFAVDRGFDKLYAAEVLGMGALLAVFGTIVTGIFIFGLLVAGHQQSGWAGAVGLAIVMLPLVARSCHEVLTLVPASIKEAGLALGGSRWRTIVTVIVPTALSGMLTSALLAVARAAGETAPLLFTTSIFAPILQTTPTQALPNIPVTIFQLSEAPEPAKHAQAWAAALVLIVFVLVISVLARILSARTRKRLAAAR